MPVPRKKSSVEAPDHELKGEANQTRVASKQTASSRETVVSSQEAAATGPLKKADQDGKSQKPPGGQYKAMAKKLPFEFADERFTDVVYTQIFEACLRKNTIDVDLFFSMESTLLKGQKPKDHHELMLINHMSGINALVMKYIGRLASADDPSQIDIYERTLNKLARTYTDQMDTLKRYRSGGDQNVTVQNVSVSDGGQAIVGNVTQNAHDDGKAKAATMPAAITDAHTAPMPIIEPSEQPIPAAIQRRRRQ